MLLLLFSLLGSLLVQAEPQQQSEMSREGILCIAQSREETALGRWLQCMQLSSSQDLQDHELPIVHLEREENSQIELFTLNKEDAHEKSAADDEQLTANQGALPTEGTVQGNSVQDEGGGIDAPVPLAMLFEDAEKSSCSHFKTEELRSVGDDVLLPWLMLNLGMLAFGKLLFSLIRRCIWKKGGKEFSEPDGKICLAEDNSMEAAPKITKGVSVNDASSKKRFESSHLCMIGRSLGSAVGAVFSEILLKLSHLGSPAPPDKISVILESAFKELSILVKDDDGCSGLVADFISAFKSTYSTSYRIQQACTLYEVSRDVNSHSPRDATFSKATFEKQCRVTTTDDEVISGSRTDLSDDSLQLKQGVPLHSSCWKRKLESKSVLTVDALTEQNKKSAPLADHGEFNSGATWSVDAPDSALAGKIEKSELKCGRQEVPTFVGNSDVLELASSNTSAKLTDKRVTQLDYEVDDASSLCEEPPGRTPRLDALALMVQNQAMGGSEFQKEFLKVYERYVRAQEQHNQIKFVRLRHSIKQQILEEEKIQLTIVANRLMQENIDLDRSKATFKENRFLEQQAKDAYVSFSTMCADELAAGLLVMLATLVYSVRKYSFALLNDLVSTCQSLHKEPQPRRSWGIHIDWFYNSLDLLAGKLQAFVCHASVTGRISFGLVVVAVVASSLLRRSVTNSSQAMPATILIIVLGGVCGFIGKVSVDSLGGSGNQWWVVWGAFCLLHAFTNCFTPSVCKLLHGSPSSVKASFGLPFWIRRFIFHMTLVLFLPVLAGLLPFGSFYIVTNDFFSTLTEILYSCISSLYEWSTHIH